jgi:glyoxylase I family protein
MVGNIHHVGLTVRDADRSAAWYHKVLGFERTGEYRAPDGSRRKVFMRHEGLSVRLGLTEHQRGRQLPFDETAIGLDHLAFAVPTRAELSDWERRFAAAGVIYTPAAPANSIPGAVVVVFRDPDNIQLELFFEP